MDGLLPHMPYVRIWGGWAVLEWVLRSPKRKAMQCMQVQTGTDLAVDADIDIDVDIHVDIDMTIALRTCVYI